MYVVMLVVSSPVLATDVTLAGVFGDKAVLIVDGRAPRTVAVGAGTPDGVKLLEVSGDSATVEIDGRKRRLVLGWREGGYAENAAAETGEVSLFADTSGHHVAQGAINGAAVRFLVDTGASLVSMGAADAQRAGIDYRRGTMGRAQTASGVVNVWKVRLDRVAVGGITLRNVEGLVFENDLPVALLGMSFLNRMELQRDGNRLTLRKRF